MKENIVMKKLMCVAVMCLVSSSVMAGGGGFWNSVNTDWYESGNWTGGGVPNAGESAWINADAVIGSGTAEAAWARVGFTENGSIAVSSGASLGLSNLRVASADSVERDGVVNVAGSMAISNELIVGEWGTGSMVLNGNGNVDASGLTMFLGMNAGSTGYLELNDNAYMSIAWLNMEGTYWGKASNATVQLNGGTLSLGSTGAITIWDGLAGNQIVFNGGSIVMPGDWSSNAQWIYDNSTRFAVGAGLTFSALYDVEADETTVTAIPSVPPRSGGQLVLTGSSSGSSLANIYPGREILSPNSPAYADGSPYSQWRMYYSGWDVDITGESVLQTEQDITGAHSRDRIYMATSTDGVVWTKHPTAILEPSGDYADPDSPWIAPDGLHVGDPCPVIGPDDKMYLFYSGAYTPEGESPSSPNIANTICVAKAETSHDGPFTKSVDNPVIWPWGGAQFVNGNTFMPTVKYHQGKFKMWFLGAEKLDGTQSAAPISIWYTECATDPMYTANWTAPIKVFRTNWAPDTWWDRFPFYMQVKIHTNLSYQIFYTGYNYSNVSEGIVLDHRQVGINHFWSSNGKDVIEDNNDGQPVLHGRFHEPQSTYPDGYFMALAYVDGWMYYGSYDHPFNSLDTKIYRYYVGDFNGTMKALVLLADQWLQTGVSIPGDLNQDGIVNLEDFAGMYPVY